VSQLALLASLGFHAKWRWGLHHVGKPFCNLFLSGRHTKKIPLFCVSHKMYVSSYNVQGTEVVPNSSYSSEYLSSESHSGTSVHKCRILRRAIEATFQQVLHYPIYAAMTLVQQSFGWKTQPLSSMTPKMVPMYPF